MIKAIIFDIGGVLIENPWTHMLPHYSNHLGVSEEAFEKAYQHVVSDWQKGLLTEEQFWEKISKQLDVPVPFSQRVWLEGVTKGYSENKEMLDLVKSLKERGYKTAVLSNIEQPVAEHIKKQNYSYFDEFIFSCEVGTFKPEPEIFYLTLEKLGILPEEAVFTDDKEENVTGAEKVGIHAIHFVDVKVFKKNLEKFLSKN